MEKHAIIVNIDGTLSNPNHRRHYVEGENKEWEKFFEKVDRDEVNDWCKKIIKRFWNDHKVILVTGRPSKSKSGVNVKGKTKQWLKDAGIIVNDLQKEGPKHLELHMREEGDFREDVVVKQEILDEQLPDSENILFAIDDREDIAEMWRQNGIPCLQCQDEVDKK